MVWVFINFLFFCNEKCSLTLDSCVCIFLFLYILSCLKNNNWWVKKKPLQAKLGNFNGLTVGFHQAIICWKLVMKLRWYFFYFLSPPLSFSMLLANMSFLFVFRTDISQYNVYEDGKLVKTTSNLQSYSSDIRYIAYTWVFFLSYYSESNTKNTLSCLVFLTASSLFGGIWNVCGKSFLEKKRISSFH